MPLPKDYSNQDLKGVSFRDKNLSYANFLDSDLRGADFTGSDLTGANFTHVKTGITPGNKVLIFVVAAIVSALSGYFAMLAGGTIQTMLTSTDSNIRNAGIATSVLVIAFLAFAYWKGGNNALKYLILPAAILALIIGIMAKFSGYGTGMGMLYLILATALTVIMFIIGTIARSAAGALSNIIFVVVALAGGLFGKSVGGGVGALIMAVGCALISKRALSGATGFDSLRNLAVWITSRFGTSFRNSKLTEANFSKSVINNSDFSNADVSTVEWGDSRKMNCIINENWLKSDGRKKQK